MTSEADRQPTCSASAATGGRRTSWPVAWPAVRTPITRPRRWTNQRVAMVAASTRAIEPVPAPMRTPQKTMSCQEAVISTLPAAPRATSSSAVVMTRRRPKRSISAAANGATSP